VALVAALVGWQAHRWLPGGLAGVMAWATAPDDPVQRAGLVGSSLEAVRQASADRVLVHIASSDAGHVGPALDGIEGLLRDARAAGRPVAVEVIANIGGIDLLRVGASPYPARVAALQAAYPELSFIACGQTLERLRERGATVQLLPGVRRASSALDQVVRRLQEGWVYVKA
jgi:intracellular sulfur oxidation DsrE/DsrF family protein